MSDAYGPMDNEVQPQSSYVAPSYGQPDYQAAPHGAPQQDSQTAYPQTYGAPQQYPQQQQGYPQTYGAPQQYPQQGYPQGYGAPQQYPQQGYAQPSYPPSHSAHNSMGAPIPAFRRVMNEEFCGCLNDCSACLMVTCLPSCVSGSNQSTLAAAPCLVACVCYVCCAGCYRSNVQNAMGVADTGCPLNCLMHMWCMICSLTQETRAIKMWFAAGRPAPAPGAMAM